MKFLLDANISPETAAFIRQSGYEAKTVQQLDLGTAGDEHIVEYAAQNSYIIITFDLDFGYLFQVLSKYHFGVIILRLEDQTVESANKALQRLLISRVLLDQSNQKALVIVDEQHIRVRKQS